MNKKGTEVWQIILIILALVLLILGIIFISDLGEGISRLLLKVKGAFG